jgi:hypothetical protein
MENNLPEMQQIKDTEIISEGHTSEKYSYGSLFVKNIKYFLDKVKKQPILIITLLAALTLFIVVIFIQKFKSARKFIFKLNENGYTYQIIKCWETNPPSYWIKKYKSDENKQINIGKCTFQAVAAIKLKEGAIDFNNYLNRDIVAEGELVEEKGAIYYQLSAVKKAPQLSVAPDPKTENNLIIKRSTPSGEEIVYSRAKNDDHKIRRWYNYLFFEPVSGYSANEKLVRYNLDTGQKDVVYSEDNHKRYLNYLEIIDDTLFFSVSGYLAGADTFWLETPESDPQKIKYDGQFGGDRIDYRYGRYWLMGSGGDGCGGVVIYALFNPKTKTATYITTSYMGCATGEEFIAMDFENRLIMSFHNMKEGGNFSDPQFYLNIIAIPINNPSGKVTLVPEELMPGDIRGIKYSSESGQLALAGDELYLFDIQIQQMQKIIDLPNDWINVYMYNWKNNRICLSEEINNYTKRIMVNLANGSVEQGAGYCADDFERTSQPQMSFEENKQKDLTELTSKLKLPSSYKIDY